VTPEKYQKHPSGVNPLDIIKFETFLTGSAIKHLLSHRYSGNAIYDLETAIVYINEEIKMFKAKEAESEEALRGTLRDNL